VGRRRARDRVLSEGSLSKERKRLLGATAAASSMSEGPPSNGFGRAVQVDIMPWATRCRRRLEKKIALFWTPSPEGDEQDFLSMGHVDVFGNGREGPSRRW